MWSSACHRCGAPFPSEDGDAARPCPSCGEPVSARLSGRIGALREHEARFREDERLPAALREEIAGRLRAEREEVEREADRLRVEEPAELAPTPAVAPAEPAAPAAAPEDAAPEEPAPEAPAPVGSDSAAGRSGPPFRRREGAASPGPTLWSRLGPAFAENLLFALAAFLIVAGAVYFTTTAWTTMTGVQQMLTIVGGLTVLGAILFTAGRLLNRGGTLDDVERVLRVIVCFLVPVAAVPTGEVLRAALGPGLLAAAVVVGGGALVGRAAARLSDPALSPWVPVSLGGAASLVVAAPAAAAFPVTITVVGAVGLAFAVRHEVRAVAPRAGPRAVTLLWPVALLAFALVVLSLFAVRNAVGTGASLGGSLSVLGIALAGIALAATGLERALARDRGSEAIPSLLVTAIALAVAGVVTAQASAVSLLDAAILGAAAAITAGLRLRRPWLLLPGLAISALAYLFLPAPVREWATALRNDAARALGYARPERLPLSWYGLTCLPYVAAAAGGAILLSRRGRAAHARVVTFWTTVVAVGLAALSVLAGADHRAPAAVLAAQGLLLLALARVARDPRPIRPGLLGVLGGFEFGLLHLGATADTQALALAVAGAALLLLAARLRRDGDDLREAVSRAIVDAVAIAAVAAGLFVGRVPSEPGVTGYVALAVLLSFLGLVYGRSGAAIAALISVIRVRSLAVVTPFGVSPDQAPLAFAAAAALPVAASLALARLAAGLRRREGRPLLVVPAAAVLLHTVGFLPLFMDPTVPGTAVAGLLLAAATLLVVAVPTRQTWCVPLAAFEIVLAGLAWSVAAGGEAWNGAAALGLAGGAAAAIGLTVAVVRRGPELLRRPLLESTAVAVGFVLGWWIGLMLALPPVPAGGAADGRLLALAGVVLAAVVRPALRHLDGVGRPEAVPFLGLCGAGALFLVPVGIFRWLDLPPEYLPFGLIAIAAAIPVWAGRRRVLAAPSLSLLAAAWVITVAWTVEGDLSAPLVLLAFALVAAGGRIAAVHAPRTGGTLLLLGAISAVSLGIGWRILDLDTEWQPALVLVAVAAAGLAPRLRATAVPRASAWIAGLPIVLFFLVVQGFWAGAVTATEQHIPRVDVRIALVLLAGAQVLAATSLASLFRARWRIVLPAIAAFLAAFALPVVNAIVHGDFERFRRPDIEVALLGVFLAARLVRRTRWSRIAYAFAAVALALTGLEFHDPSTPFAVLAATAVPLALLRGGRSAVHGDLFAGGLVLTAYAFAAWLAPAPEAGGIEILLLLAALSGLLLVAGAIFTARRPGSPATPGIRRVLPALAILVIAEIGLSLILHGRRPAHGVEALLAAFAAACVGAVSVHVARRRARPAFLHAAIVAAGVLYAFLAVRTNALDLLRHHHLEACALGGLGLFLLGERRGPLAPHLRPWGIALPIPVVVTATLSVLGALPVGADDARGLLLAAVVYGVAGLRLPNRGVVGFAVVLLDLALFALWRHRGIVDPAFYGVPAGLTLLAAGEVVRSETTRAGRLALHVTGAALLYGSVAIQVLRVEQPAHALVLFGAGLATVVYGFVRDRNEFLVTGTTVVVIDVIAYLARHGYEQGFLGAGLLVAAGLTVLTVATIAARRRRGRKETSDDGAPAAPTSL